MIHAVTICLIVLQFTAPAPRVRPVPMIVPLATWVVETGTPNDVMNDSTAPPDIAAEKPW